MYTVTDIISAIAKLESLEAVSNACDEAWERNPESSAAEAAFDEAYKAEWVQREACIVMIAEFTNHAIDTRTAGQLIKPDYRARLINAIHAV